MLYLCYAAIPYACLQWIAAICCDRPRFWPGRTLEHLLGSLPAGVQSSKKPSRPIRNLYRNLNYLPVFQFSKENWSQPRFDMLNLLKLTRKQTKHIVNISYDIRKQSKPCWSTPPLLGWRQVAAVSTDLSRSLNERLLYHLDRTSQIIGERWEHVENTWRTRGEHMISWDCDFTSDFTWWSHSGTVLIYLFQNQRLTSCCLREGLIDFWANCNST